MKIKFSNNFYLKENEDGEFYYEIPVVISVKLDLDDINCMSEPIKSEVLTAFQTILRQKRRTKTT